MRLISALIVLVVRFLSIIGLAALILGWLLLDFMSRTNEYVVSGEVPRTAIVFSGQYDRVHLGLNLLSSGTLDRLFISGVNRKAGLGVARFSEQFALTPEQVGWVSDGKIILAPDARSTLENALEAACWLDQQPDIDAVTLITSQRHMARASAALQHKISPTSIARVVSDPSNTNGEYKIDLAEFSKFAATWFVTLLPASMWPANEPSLCRGE